ncbi:MAG: 6,7-dimethyl-8-ribityllumazine synthase [bacterium]
MLIEGDPAPGDRRFLILAARFNRWITDRLVTGASGELLRRGTRAERIDTAWVPGSFELPAAARAAAGTGRYAAVICVGAILKGETSHARLIADTCARGIQDASAATGVPVTLGVIAADTFEQAEARCHTDGGRNLGADAAAAAADMAGLLARLREGP